MKEAIYRGIAFVLALGALMIALPTIGVGRVDVEYGGKTLSICLACLAAFCAGVNWKVPKELS